MLDRKIPGRHGVLEAFQSRKTSIFAIFRDFAYPNNTNVVLFFGKNIVTMYRNIPKMTVCVALRFRQELLYSSL